MNMYNSSCISLRGSAESVWGGGRHMTMVEGVWMAYADGGHSVDAV